MHQLWFRIETQQVLSFFVAKPETKNYDWRFYGY